MSTAIQRLRSKKKSKKTLRKKSPSSRKSPPNSISITPKSLKSLSRKKKSKKKKSADISACAFSRCVNKVFDTFTYTINHYSHKEFCEEHWTLVSSFFKRIGGCTMKSRGCNRNHQGEYYKEYLTKRSVKFLDRVYNLCDNHWALYRTVWRGGRE